MKAIDLFAGCGGLSLGFIKDGYTIEKAIEFNAEIAATYQKNHPEVEVIVDDIRHIDRSDVFKRGDADVIIGGPPCQGFSMAGARIREGFMGDPRNFLFKHYFNVVRTVKPKAFVMENVKGIQTMQNGEIFEEINQKTDIDEIITRVNELIRLYSLNKQNVEGYNRLRADYNANKSPLQLFVLTCYSFNHQIRFNHSFQFNVPFAKERGGFNASIEQNLIQFVTALQEKHIILSSTDFRDFPFDRLKSGDMVYCDPPYLITTASYNDGNRGHGGWGVEEDRDLLHLLDELNSKNIRFALSNVFYHKGKENETLIKWSEKYHVTYLDKTYSNCNYHLKDKSAKTVEVLITNEK